MTSIRVEYVTILLIV